MSFSRGHSVQVLSFLKPEECAEHGGLPGVAIQGEFTDAERSVAGFRVNRAFVEFLHEVIRAAGPADPSMQEAAKQQGEGWLYIIDLRTPEGPEGQVPAEDIIGAFAVKAGKLVADSYSRNEGYRVLTKNGPVRLPPSLHDAMVRAALKRG